MFNTYNYNTTMYNALSALIPEASSDSIVFNSYSLQNTEVISQILLHDSAPDRDFITNPVPRGHGQIINGDFWRRKVVKVSGIVKKSTGAALELELDNMKKYLGVGESNLDIAVSGAVRRYVATLINGNDMFSRRQGYHINFCPFELEFECSTPFAQSVNYVAQGFLDKSDLVFIEQANNGGTTDAKPVVVLNFTAATGVTAISFKNNTTNEEIKLTKNISAGDYIRFDSETLEVTKNAVLQDYDGAFPKLKTGANLFTITVTGTSATYDLTIKHKTPYL